MLRTILAVVFSLGCAGFGHIFLRAMRAERYRRAFWLKGAAGLCFLAVGLLLTDRSRLSLLVVGGLLLGLAGDELLALRFVWPERHDRMFLLGGISFALGHGLYLAARIGRDAGALPLSLLFLLFLLLFAFVCAWKCRFKPGSFLVPGSLYLALVAFMAAMACACAVRDVSVAALLFAAGGISFLASDTLLGAYTFGSGHTFGVNRAVHITYYGAQLLIAWSLCF